MIKLIAKLLITALAFLATAEFVPGIMVASFYVAMVLAVVWGFINITLRPLLLFVTLPINFLTIGLFTFVINGSLFWFLGTIIKGFEVEGFLVAMLGAVIVSLISSIGDALLWGKKRGLFR